jgi:hypothetical protein
MGDDIARLAESYSLLIVAFQCNSTALQGDARKPGDV